MTPLTFNVTHRLAHWATCYHKHFYATKKTQMTTLLNVTILLTYGPSVASSIQWYMVNPYLLITTPSGPNSEWLLIKITTYHTHRYQTPGLLTSWNGAWRGITTIGGAFLSFWCTRFWCLLLYLFRLQILHLCQYWEILQIAHPLNKIKQNTSSLNLLTFALVGPNFSSLPLSPISFSQSPSYSFPLILYTIITHLL